MSPSRTIAHFHAQSVCSSREMLDVALLTRVSIVSELLAQARGPVSDRHGVLDVGRHS